MAREQPYSRKRVSRTEPALTPPEEKGKILAQYLGRYQSLEVFQHDFNDLVEQFRLISPLSQHDIAFAGYDDQGPGVARKFQRKKYGRRTLQAYCEQILTLRDFAATVRTFAQRWHLDCLADDRGCSILYAMCWYRVDLPPYLTEDLAGACAALYDKSDENGHFASEMGRVVDSIYRQYDTELVVHVEMEWSANFLTRDQMRKLLRDECERQISEALDEAVIRLENRGYVFPPAQPTEMERHLDWLFRRVYYCESPAKIAVSENGMNDEVISKRTNGLAKVIELTIPAHR